MWEKYIFRKRLCADDRTKYLLAGVQAFKMNICYKTIREDDTADLWQTNSKKQHRLDKTGIIKPCEQAQSVELGTAPKVGTPIALKIMVYQPDAYYSENADTANSVVN